MLWSRATVTGPGRADALYDLASDPAEAENRLALDPTVVRRMEATLAHTDGLLAHCDPAAQEAMPPPTAEQCEMLKGLGYVDDCETATR